MDRADYEDIAGELHGLLIRSAAGERADRVALVERMQMGDRVGVALGFCPAR